MNGPPLSEGLRHAARQGASRPLQPIAHPWHRAGLTVAVGLGAAVLAIAVCGLRSNAPTLGVLTVWGPALLRVAAGALLIALAMREGVPGEGPAAGVRRVALLVVPALLVLGAEWPARAAGDRTADLGPLLCFPRAIVLALPATGLVAWLLARAYPLHPVFAATAGALGAALLADAVMHLTCPATARAHTLFIHGGAVATLAMTGALLGWLRLLRRARGTL